jgi:hypothetical protein
MKSFLLAASALTMLCGTAFAQTLTSGSTSGANVNTTSGSQSVATSSPRVSVYGNPIGNGASSSNSSASVRTNSRSTATGGQSSSTSAVTINNSYGSGTSATDPAGTAAGAATGSGTDPSYSISGTQTIRNTPEVIAPSIVGGNPCSVGVTSGLSLPGFGIVGGGSWEGKGCERRQLAALLYNMGYDLPTERGLPLQQAAVEVLCNNDDVRAALKSVGQPCIADRAVAAAAPASAPPATAVVAPVTATPLPAPQAPQRPDWCATASKAELRSHPACDVKA